ncbi:hypothetical protein Vafri_17126 [Volvox africanus]|uniref:Guanylate cyclase domain-containing protein n=1 Tax=Volvox africanus TaxID=51714 RepID=A0A8J4BKC4_9CHLO|nr:hypothetical protein Vafri_17126 [Volvox africanus]
MRQWRGARRAAACLQRFGQATLGAVRTEPWILAVATVMFLVLLAIGLSSVLTASAASVRGARDLAEGGLGSQVVQSLKEAMLIGTFGSELLATAVRSQPECAALEAKWPFISEDIIGKVDSELVRQLEIDVGGVIWRTVPELQGELAKTLYGRDLLKEPGDRPGVLYALSERTTLFMGPYECRDEFRCAAIPHTKFGITVTPLFLPAPSAEYDWGCGVQPYNCTDLCWDPVNKTKYWGQVSAVLNLNSLLTGNGTRLQMLEQRGYSYKLWQAATSVSNPYVVLGRTSQLPRNPVTLTFTNFNVLWYLEMAPRGGWVPPWRAPCLAAVVVGSALISLLVMWLLVSKEQHNRLLKAMLPRKVIQQLQAGEVPIAEEYDMVTVLFSDIVGYTCVTSQLSPRQVVTLLNELFSVFDDLSQRNGVYKVETIGDALMCVAGCPVPDDPIASAVRIARMALDMVNAVQQFRPSLEGVQGVKIRVGIHSGPIVAGVVGKKMPRYCLFGDTVNTSSRMESTSEPMMIQVSPITAALLRASRSGFHLEPRGPVDIKGKGMMETFWLNPGLELAPRAHWQGAALERQISLEDRLANIEPRVMAAMVAPPRRPAKRLTFRAMTCPESGKQTPFGPPSPLPIVLAAAAAPAMTAARSTRGRPSPSPLLHLEGKPLQQQPPPSRSPLGEQPMGRQGERQTHRTPSDPQQLQLDQPRLALQPLQPLSTSAVTPDGRTLAAAGGRGEIEHLGLRQPAAAAALPSSLMG